MPNSLLDFYLSRSSGSNASTTETHSVSGKPSSQTQGNNTLSDEPSMSVRSQKTSASSIHHSSNEHLVKFDIGSSGVDIDEDEFSLGNRGVNHRYVEHNDSVDEIGVDPTSSNVSLANKRNIVSILTCCETFSRSTSISPIFI